MNKITVAQQGKTASSLPPTHGILQRKCACGTHTMAGGECADCAKRKSGLQRNLSIGASNDPLEQEADRIAEQVMAGPAPSSVKPIPPRIQRFSGRPAWQTDSAPASVDRVLASPGRPLEPTLRQDMEQRFGHDFSHVRVHTGATAEQSARDVSAHAYTVGHNLVFGQGQFASGTSAGQRLIAHELTHVVQQGAQGVPVRDLPIAFSGNWAEREAGKTAARWSMDSAWNIRRAFVSPQVQRQVDDQGIGNRVSPNSTSRCHTCQIPGGVGVCCLADNAPLVPECFEPGKKIIDTCQGPPTSCLEQAQCAQCQCIGQKLGQQYCQCTGIV